MNPVWLLVLLVVTAATAGAVGYGWGRHNGTCDRISVDVRARVERDTERAIAAHPANEHPTPP